MAVVLMCCSMAGGPGPRQRFVEVSVIPSPRTAAWSAVRQHSRWGQSEGATSPRMGVMTGTTRADCEITGDHAATAGWVRRRTV
jgi:hypothetical protein